MQNPKISTHSRLRAYLKSSLLKFNPIPTEGTNLSLAFLVPITTSFSSTTKLSFQVSECKELLRARSSKSIPLHVLETFLKGIQITIERRNTNFFSQIIYSVSHKYVAYRFHKNMTRFLLVVGLATTAAFTNPIWRHMKIVSVSKHLLITFDWRIEQCSNLAVR